LIHIDACHVTSCTLAHDQIFRWQTHSRAICQGQGKEVPSDVASRAARKLEYVRLAEQLEDLKVPLGNRLHSLYGNRQGQHAISINDQWRICFRFEDGDAYEVEVCDYH